MKKKMTPHIIAVMVLMFFVLLGLAGCMSMTPEQQAEAALKYKEAMLDPDYKGNAISRGNKFELELKFADKNIPTREQSILYLDKNDAINFGGLFYTGYGKALVIPPKTDQMFVHSKNEFGDEMRTEVTFKPDAVAGTYSQSGLFKGFWETECLSLEPGVSYWIRSDVSSGSYRLNYLMGAPVALIPLTEEGIRDYTQKLWDRMQEAPDGTFEFGPSVFWTSSSYEEFHQFVTQVWQIRMDNVNGQIK